MVAISSNGPAVTDSEEVEVLACSKALEFAVDAGFSELVIEGDNINVMKSIASPWANLLRLGHIYDDIRCIVGSLRHVEIKYTRRSANNVAHSLARHAKHIDDVVWLEESPPSALEALYLDSLSISERMKFDFAFKNKIK